MLARPDARLYATSGWRCRSTCPQPWATLQSPDAQALQPFIDPRTARKIVFVGRGAAGEGRAGVPPGTLAACGVGAPGWAFDAAAYAAACRALEARAGAPPRAAGAPPGAAAGPGA